MVADSDGHLRTHIVAKGACHDRPNVVNVVIVEHDCPALSFVVWSGAANGSVLHATLSDVKKVM